MVPLPDGTDPADLIERDGAGALRERVEQSAPFVVFHVERILEQRRRAGAPRGEIGRCVSSARCSPGCRRASLRDDLVRRVAGRLELSEANIASLVSGPGSTAANGTGGAPANGGVPAAGGRMAVSGLEHGVRAERGFLVLCVAVPSAGDVVLKQIDPGELLTSELYRRAARHLAGRCASPLSDLPDDDEQLAKVVADLVARAGRSGQVGEDHLEHARLVLDLARKDRAIVRARAASAGGITELAREREQVLVAIRAVTARLERAV